MNKKILAIVLFIAYCNLLNPMFGDNPIVIDRGLTDPKVRVYDNHVFLYATHDASPGNTKFTMNDWWVWSTDDLVHWKYESTLKPEETYWGKPASNCWATDAVCYKGKYYFYFSRGPTEIGVVQSDTPTGPWTDSLHKPLVQADSLPTKARDPAILQEPDGTTYLIFGTWDYYIAKLNPDMISFAEPPRKVEILNKEGPYGKGKTDDKSFLHKYNGKYYLSWGCYYAMSDNVYGPYSYKGCIITEERTSPEFNKALNGLTYDRHASFFELYNQWYFICNDQSWPGTSKFYRDSVISYLHYKNNGEIDPIYIDRIGVGQYDAGQPRIEAENYFKSEGVTQRECPEGGFELEDIHDQSTVTYPNIKNISANSMIYFRIASSDGAGTIEVHQDNPEGFLLGTCPVAHTGGWNKYSTISTLLHNQAGTIDLCLVFRGAKNEIVRLNWLSFHP